MKQHKLLLDEMDFGTISDLKLSLEDISPGLAKLKIASAITKENAEHIIGALGSMDRELKTSLPSLESFNGINTGDKSPGFLLETVTNKLEKNIDVSIEWAESLEQTLTYPTEERLREHVEDFMDYSRLLMENMEVINREKDKPVSVKFMNTRLKSINLNGDMLSNENVVDNVCLAGVINEACITNIYVAGTLAAKTDNIAIVCLEGNEELNNILKRDAPLSELLSEIRSATVHNVNFLTTNILDAVSLMPVTRDISVNIVSEFMATSTTSMDTLIYTVKADDIIYKSEETDSLFDNSMVNLGTEPNIEKLLTMVNFKNFDMKADTETMYSGYVVLDERIKILMSEVKNTLKHVKTIVSKYGHKEPLTTIDIVTDMMTYLERIRMILGVLVTIRTLSLKYLVKATKRTKTLERITDNITEF